MTRIKILLTVAALILIGLIVWMIIGAKKKDDIEVIDRFDDKIVYTTDMSLSEDPFRAHCKEAGGLFNACGSPCPTHQEVCASVCAYTCEDL